MGRPYSRRRSVLFASIAATVLAGAALTACSSSGSTSNAAGGKTLTFAEQPGAAPNYIFPMASAQHFTGANYFRLIYLLYRPLYWMTTNGALKVNSSLSLASLPVFSDGDTVVTITLKPWKWSDGKPVTARDIQFWQNLVTANKADWASYVPGEYPDNIVSTKVVNTRTIQFKLNRSYNPQWFLYNELSQIVPLPQQAWDKESATGSVGTFDTTPAGAQSVYNFLNAQASDTSTYDTNPLWKTVDGPFKLQGYTLNGPITFVRNTAYSGPATANYTKFEELPYTSADAEYNALLAGSLDYGYVPANDLVQTSRVTSQGYKVELWPHWGINFVVPNYNNPKLGSTFKQLYVRQALEELVDQTGDIKDFYDGQATPTYGPVPKVPKTDFLSPVEQTNMYGYSPASAKSLLTAHGWSAEHGVDTCVRPGSAANECGAGVAAGTTLSMTLLYSSGTPAFQNVIEAMQSAATSAGIALQLRSEPADSVSAALVPCTSAQAVCSWQLIADGNGWGYGLDYQPSGDEILATGADANWGSYSSPTADSLINQTHYSDSSSAFSALESYLTTNIPLIWLPEQPVQVSAIQKDVTGVGTQGPLLSITPELWQLSG
jgi:peptide/nickel transport system substrate-binding protein